MARRDRGNAATATTEAPAEATTTEEVAVTDTATEAPASTEGDAAPAAAEKPAETPINLDAFTAAVDKAYEARAEDTGIVPEEALNGVTTAYRALDGAKPKNAAKALVNERLKDAVNKLDVYAGKAYMMISEALTAGAGAKTEKAPADPAEAYVQRVVTLQLAQSLVTVPEGVEADAVAGKVEEQLNSLLDPAQTYFEWVNRGEDDADRGDEPDVNNTVKAAVKLALGKTAKAGGKSTSSGGGASFDGPRRDIGEHIKEAFADKASGDFLTIAEIRNFKSSEYGDDNPSAGAISARLFPQSGKVSLDFVEPATNEKGHRGARKK